MRRARVRSVMMVLAAGVQTSAVFACEAGMARVVQCNTTAQKQLEICIGQGKASYAFGPQGRPELALTQPLGQVQGSAWSGVGRYAFESIDFTNDGYTYNMIATRDRLVQDAPFQVGVEVTDASGDIVAGVACRPARMTFNPGAIDRGFEAAGLCWDRTALRYTRACS